MTLAGKVAVFLVIGLVFLSAAIWVTFLHTVKCESFECFQNEMRKCDRATHVNDDVQATWKYDVKGERGGACRVEVTLLQVKEGELAVQRLEGESMECGFPGGVATYPEKDLERCTGRLKESLQAIVIKKLHTYIIENLGDIEQGLNLLSPPI